jgi:tetratricopeptide (TPR) repeat protein
MNRARLWRAALVIGLLVLIPLIVVRLQATQQVPDSPSAQQLIRLNLATGRLYQAVFQVELAAAKTGWTGELAWTAGLIWERLGDLPRAAAYWETSSRLAPSERILRRLASLYLELHHWSDASETLQRLIDSSPEDNWAHYHLGLVQAAFDPRSAKAHLRLAARDPLYRDLAYDLHANLSDAPIDSAAAMTAGLVLAEHSLWPYAELAFRQAANLGAPFPEALAYTGLAQDRQGKDGTQAVTQAITLAPNNPQLLYLYGLHLRVRGDLVGSLSAFLQAATLNLDNPAYAAEVGTAYQLLDQLGEAEMWLKTALSLSNNDPRFQSLLDAFYAELPTPLN